MEEYTYRCSDGHVITPRYARRVADEAPLPTIPCRHEFERGKRCGKEAKLVTPAAP
jgi:hypothetical protein